MRKGEQRMEEGPLSEPVVRVWWKNTVQCLLKLHLDFFFDIFSPIFLLRYRFTTIWTTHIETDWTF